MTAIASTASIDHSDAIGFRQYVAFLTEYAESWIPETRDAILANALHYQDAGLRVALRNWSALKDEFETLSARARLEFAEAMSKAMDEPTADRQEAAREQALADYRDSMEYAEFTRRRVESYKQVLDDLIFFSVA